MTPERREKLLSVINKRQNNITVVLENVFDPHNESAVMRSCDSIGIQDIYIINNRKPTKKEWGFRSSSGSKKWLTIHQFTTVKECVAELRRNYSGILTTHLASDSVNLYNIDLTGSIALVFGNERWGCSDEIRSLADGSLLFPSVE